MTRLRTPILVFCALALMPAAAAAQSSSADSSRLWIVAGSALATTRGDCQNCEADYPYRHSPSVLGAFGYRVNDRANVGGELFWVPIDNEQGQIRTTHINAVAQVRLWRSRGFFLKGGAGMAFVRNWIDGVTTVTNQKMLSVVIGGGWEFRSTKRVGFEVFATQHAGAIGDLQIQGENVSDVVGNFWSVGAALVFR